MIDFENNQQIFAFSKLCVIFYIKFTFLTRNLLELGSEESGAIHTTSDMCLILICRLHPKQVNIEDTKKQTAVVPLYIKLRFLKVQNLAIQSILCNI